MTSFEEALRAHLEAKPRLTAKDEQIMDILNSRPSRRRDRRLARMENHARAVVGIDPNKGAVDWDSIDWSKFLSQILEILVKLLPFILAL